MIDMKFTGEEELSPRCMALPSNVYAIEVTEDILFEPTPKRVHLFSRSDNKTMPPLYYWETVTPFGGFGAKYLHSEYPGKLFQVLTVEEELFLVRVPGRDRELGTSPTTTPAPATTTAATTTSIIANSSTPRSIITTQTTTVLTTPPVNNVRRATTNNVWTLETIPPIAGLSFCLVVLLTLYVRRVVWRPAGDCFMCICRWLAARRRRRNNRKTTNDDIELTTAIEELTDFERASTSSSNDADETNNTTVSSTTTTLSFASFLNVALEEDE